MVKNAVKSSIREVKAARSYGEERCLDLISFYCQTSKAKNALEDLHAQ